MKTPQGERPYVSGLDIRQAAALTSAGVQLLGHVTATYAYHCEPDGERTLTGEMKGWRRAEQRAYDTLLSRIQARAQELGATGVVAAQFVRQSRPWDKHLFEMTCQGTAIVTPEQPTRVTPFVCVLSGTELLCLRQAGYAPVGHVVGLCEYYQAAHLRVERKLLSGGRQKRVTPNVERSDFTKGYYKARSNAMRRLEEQAERLGAVGVIGVHVQVERGRLQDRAFTTAHVGRMTMRFVAQGTALRSTAPPQGDAVGHVVPLHI